MQFDLDRRLASLSVGEFSDFTLGPRGSGASGGLWRAQLGTHWHLQLRGQMEDSGSDAAFEVPITGTVLHKGWVLTLTGRIDQIVREQGRATLREIKTVTRPVPVPEDELRADYPEYFAQLSAYVDLAAEAGIEGLPKGGEIRGELVFVETDSGLAQTVSLEAADRGAYRERLDRVAEFLDLRLRARERMRGLRFRSPFAELRPGQETVAAELRTAVRAGRSAILLEAPTGFGKTGVLLEFVLGELREGHFDRALYLTGKSTGQIQVAATLAAMTAGGPDLGDGAPVAAWLVRNKAEHCVNTVFRCVKEVCPYLDGIEERWRSSGLARFYLIDNLPRDLASLRAAGFAARICPYEITRAALAFNDVWIGDYNYVFSPESSSLFSERPGFEPGRTLLVVDEAHNLPSRAADARSHSLFSGEARELADALRRARAPARIVSDWEGWAAFVDGLDAGHPLAPELEAEARSFLANLAEKTASVPVDPAALDSRLAPAYWQAATVAAQLEDADLPRLWWCPRAGEIAITCLDAATAAGASLREFGGVVLATATPGPIDAFAVACGLEPAALLHLRAATPWREGAYDVAVDLRVDTSFQARMRHVPVTGATVAALRSGQNRAVAVFFPSFAYAEEIAREMNGSFPDLRVALQPRRRELSAQAAWVAEAVAGADALFLVLGSGFAEGIDILGDRIGRAMVVGPALPEVNPVQRAKLASLGKAGREAAFERVYRIPGMQKVNQALGRLVRAPGQKARVLLHCRRFAEPGYARLLAPEYQSARRILDDGELRAWLDAS